MKADPQLQQDVIAELVWDPSVNAARIGVEVRNGVVTLAGDVDSCMERFQVERAALRVAGVRAVVLEIDVLLPGTSQRHDPDIAAAAVDVLAWTACLSQESIEVSSGSGWITLSGTVAWHYQREAASRAVRNLVGVVGVHNGITIRPHASTNDVKAEIEAALRRRIHADATRINVDVRGSAVTLSGTAQNWLARQLAAGSAWAMPGVHQVIDNITVKY